MLNRMRVGQRVMAGFGIILILLCLVSVVGIIQLRGVLQEFNLIMDVEHPIDHEISRLKELNAEMETGLMGFTITGKEEFLEPYRASKDEFDRLLEKLKNTLKDRPADIPLLQEILAVHNDWEQTVVEPQIQLRRNIAAGKGDIKEIIDLVSTGKGKSMMDKIRKNIEEIEKIEDATIETRVKEAHYDSAITNKVIIRSSRAQAQ